MADLFTSLVAISPNQSKVSGNAATRIPGTSPQMKDGIWTERAVAAAGTPTYAVEASLNAVVTL